MNKTVEIHDSIFHYYGGIISPQDQDTIIHVVVHPLIKKIDASAFSGCRYLKSIKLPNNLIEIGNRAFKCCSSLISINLNLPDRVEMIGDFAFDECHSLISIILLIKLKKWVLHFL